MRAEGLEGCKRVEGLEHCRMAVGLELVDCTMVGEQVQDLEC